MQCRLIAALAGIDVLCSAPAERDGVHPLRSRDPDGVDGTLVHLGDAQLVPDVAGTARVGRGDEQHCLRCTNGCAQGFFPIERAWLEAFAVDPDVDVLAQQVGSQARDEFAIGTRIAEKHERVDERLEQWPAPDQHIDRNGEAVLRFMRFSAATTMPTTAST